MSSSNSRHSFYNGETLSSLIQNQEHTAIMRENQVPLIEKALITENATTQIRMPSTDHLNSAIANSINTKHHNFTFTPYGFIDPFQTNSLLGFTGQLRQAVTGYYLLGSRRAFNPTTMRFNSYDDRSPFAEGDINGYAYCGCDPVNYTDPSGMSRWQWFKKNVLRIKPNTKKIDAAFERGRQQGYEEGFSAGHSSGYNKGLKEGYASGFDFGRDFGSKWGFAEGKIAGSKRLNRPLQTFVERAEHILEAPLPLGIVTSKYFNANQNDHLRVLANLRLREADLEQTYFHKSHISPEWDSQSYMKLIREFDAGTRFKPTGS